MTTATLSPDQKRERVIERASRLYEDGYRAAKMPFTQIYLMISPGGAAYELVPNGEDECCTCAFYANNGFCKHSEGLLLLLNSQERAAAVRRAYRKIAGSSEAPARTERTERPGANLCDINRDF